MPKEMTTQILLVKVQTAIQLQTLEQVQFLSLQQLQFVIQWGETHVAHVVVLLNPGIITAEHIHVDS
ncbi:hypothetical protein [Pseudoalteromonas phenolica]|uniref:hypothetical protein n=1 Tax=Pseudoalteromonas phenolica TaxID=161398 RepID=UPI00110AE0E2|nr:hypothetical protein [Pseudoalteromonas phenolica]TMO54379.1 hypothetical protein CWC21_15705 [Pseudoalteromonas phenolica]